jgi:hypothetical protein
MTGVGSISTKITVNISTGTNWGGGEEVLGSGREGLKTCPETEE